MRLCLCLCLCLCLQTAYANTGNAFQWSPLVINWNGTNTADADIAIRTDQRNTPIDGFGAALTDASASLLMQIKQTNASVYNSTLYSLFNRRSGLSIIRVPIGASDYSLPGKTYTFSDSQGSSSDPLSKYSTKGAQQYIFPVLRDIVAVNPSLKISILPWTPPAWMKANAALNGGSLSNGMTATLVEYLAQAVRAFDTAVGVKPWALAVQNEPFNSMPYPSMVMTTGLQIQVLNALRGRLAQLGYGQTLLWGLEDDFVHWDAAETIIKQNASSLDGIAWHCYNGSWHGAQSLRNAVADQASGLRMAMTECTGQDTDSGDVSSFRWWSQNIFFPMLAHNFSSILVWNLALNSDFGPHLSSTVCQNCKGAIEIDSASVGPSLQSIMMQHMAVASSDLTRFGSGAGPATSLNVTIAHDQSCGEALAFSAPWNSSAHRYGLVVENSCSNQTSMTVAFNQRTATLSFVPGLSSYVWTM